MTAVVECVIEPWAEKALRLLRSKEEESTDQLRLMLEESIRQKYGHKKSLKRIVGPYSEKDEPPPKKRKDTKKSSDSDSSSCSTDGSDLVTIIDTYSCKVCRSATSGPSNQLVDCAECHNHFHQECHNPPITDCDVNDPRVVWYCSSCSKTVAKPKPSAGNGSSPSSSSSSSKSSSKIAAARGGVSFSSKPFGGTSSSTSTRKSGGTSSTTSATSSKGSSSTSTKNVPNLNIIHADKRLQIMKKKAAKKQEKRGISK